MTIDKQMLQNFRQDFADAVKDLEQKYGVVIKLDKISYGATEFDAKLHVAVGNSQDEVDKQEFERYCSAYGLLPSDYGSEFTGANGERYTFVTIKPQYRKYAIIIKNLRTGQVSRCTKDFIK